MGYLPRFQKQLDGSRYAGLNCNCASAAMAADYDSLGQTVPSPSQVRLWTGDTSGGTNLAQVDMALRDHTPTDLDTRYRLPWADFTSLIASGRAAILQGGYGPIADSRFDAGRGFRGNHSVLVAPRYITMDPLADGRAPGVYKYKGEAYPQSLLRSFAGHLNLSGPGGASRLLGDGLVYAAFTRDNEKDYHATVRAGPVGVYTIVSGVIAPNGARTAITGGFSAACSAPRLYRWPGHTSQSLVQLTDGSHRGWYIRSTWAKEVV